MLKKSHLLLALSLGLIAMSSCQAGAPGAPTPTPPLADELIFYDWVGYMPQSVLDAFTEAYGVKVTYLTYEFPTEAENNIRAGQVYDAVVLGNFYVQSLLADGLLAEIDYSNVPNFKNVPVSFRDLVYDPNNRHSVVLQWGTTGLVVRSDLVHEPVTRWADLWDPRYAGRIGLWPYSDDVLGIALKSLGYSHNSEDPRELDAALQHLLELKPRIFFIDANLPNAASLLADGTAVMVYGWSYDALAGRELNENITYVLPAEGTILWGDNFVIPANSPNRYTAELFLNFLLRPEIGALVVNELYVSVPNDAVLPFVLPELQNDPVIFPPQDSLRNAEIYMQLSPEGQALHDRVWEEFMSATP